MQERRFYERIKVDVACNVYNNGEEEIGKIIDLSEDGMLIEMSLPAYEEISPAKGKEIKYMLIDKINVFKKDIYMVNTMIVKHHYIKDNKGYIGCMCTDKEFTKYVLDKKTDILHNVI